MDLGGGSTTFLGIIVEKLLLKIVIPTFFKRGPISRISTKFPISGKTVNKVSFHIKETVNTFISISDIGPLFGLFLEYISKRRGVPVPRGNILPLFSLSIIYTTCFCRRFSIAKLIKQIKRLGGTHNAILYLFNRTRYYCFSNIRIHQIINLTNLQKGK